MGFGVVGEVAVGVVIPAFPEDLGLALTDLWAAGDEVD